LTHQEGIKDILHALADMAAGQVTSDPIQLNDLVTLRVAASWFFQVGDLTFAPMITLDGTDLVFDWFSFDFQVEVPKIEIGGQVVCIRNPDGGFSCWKIPPVTLYEGGNFEFSVVFDGFHSEIDRGMDLKIVHFLPGEADQIDAATRFFRQNHLSTAFADTPEASDFFTMAMRQGWELRLIPGWLDVDLIDEAGTAASKFHTALDSAVEQWGADLSTTERDALLDISGSLADHIEGLLDIHDDIETWVLATIADLGITRQANQMISDRLGFLYLIKILEEQKFRISEDIHPVVFEISNAAPTIEPEGLRIEVDIKAPDL
jgi:hypothetical protein